MIVQIISMIIVGGIVGALARLFLKGDQQISIVWTVVLGAGGAASAPGSRGCSAWPPLPVSTGSVGSSR